MERRRRQAVATFFAADGLVEGPRQILDEDAAHHARVRRLDAGDEVRVTDGRGSIATGRIVRVAKSALEIDVMECSRIPSADPLLALVPVADRDRMLWLAEKLTEIGVTTWQPVVFERSRSVSPRGEGAAFADKVRARMRGAVEQSGSAWLPEVRDEIDVAGAVLLSPSSSRFLLDASGPPLLSFRPRGAVAIALGPEGGITTEEHELFLHAGWVPASLGAATLRFETAGIAAAAIARAAQHD